MFSSGAFDKSGCGPGAVFPEMTGQRNVSGWRRVVFQVDGPWTLDVGSHIVWFAKATFGHYS